MSLKKNYIFNPLLSILNISPDKHLSGPEKEVMSVMEMKERNKKILVQP